MTHEDEELQHDLSKLQEQVHQILLSQRASKNEMEVLKKGMEVNMDGLKNTMDGLKKGVEAKMDGLKNNMDVLKKGMEAKMDGMEDGMDAKMDEWKKK